MLWWELLRPLGSPKWCVHTALRAERSLSEQAEATCRRPSQETGHFLPLGGRLWALFLLLCFSLHYYPFVELFWSFSLLFFFFHFPSLFPNLYSLLLPYQLLWDLKQFKSWNFTLEIKLLRILHFSVYWDLTAGLMAPISVHLDPVSVFSVAPYTLFLLNYYFWHLEYIFILS